jgi:chaperonin GroES
MQIRPLSDRLTVRRAAEDKATAGGIIIPGATEKPNQGTVIAVGSGRVLSNGQTLPMSVAVGDVIVFGKHSGQNTVEVDGEELVILNESDVYGVLEGKEV